MGLCDLQVEGVLSHEITWMNACVYFVYTLTLCPVVSVVAADFRVESCD